MVNIVNGTSHEIHIYDNTQAYYISSLRKWFLRSDGEPCHIIPAGTNLNAQMETAELCTAHKFPFYVTGAVVFTGHDPVPDGDIVVVSQLYRSAVIALGGDTSRLATVNETVYASEINIRPVGCMSLAIG